ncbi:CoA transferase [Streptomyces sp. NPDC055299]
MQVLDRTADGHLMVAAGNDALWRRFATAIGLARLARLVQLVDESRFATNPHRVRHRGELLPLIERAPASRGAQEWAGLLTGEGVPVGPINTVDQALRALASPLKLSEHPTAVRTPPPRHGEHTAQVLTALGAGPGQLARLRARRAVK